MNRTMPRAFPLIAALTLFAAWMPMTATAGYNAQLCGALENAYGPFDYTDPIHKRQKLPVVERHHFNRDVAQARRGVGTKNTPGQDIDYTLRAFPNHHAALYAVMLYTMQVPLGRHPKGLQFAPDCYYQRALAWRPNDPTVHMVYGVFLSKTGKLERALEEYETAIELSPEYAEAHYNYGLLLLDNGRHEKALEHAQRAYELGFPLDGLKRKLLQAGVWRDAADAGS
ncbi:MAG: tetratricopeptide repeat protein [Pseudomonadota bacterium]